MAKDPAVLLYVQDFLVGTSLLTPLQKGHYITLLCYQQQSETGSLPELKIKQVMGKDYLKHWTVIKSKFMEDDNGFYNARMRSEIERRKRTSEKQSDRAKERWKKENECRGFTEPIPSVGNAFYATEIETERKGGVGEKWNTRPGPDQMDLKLPDIKAGAVVEFFGIAKKINISHGQVSRLWTVFKQQHFNGEKYYGSENEAFSHFINWSQTKKIEDAKPGPPMEQQTAYKIKL